MRAIAILLLLAQPAGAAELYLQIGAAHQFRHGACDGTCWWDSRRYAATRGAVEIGVEQAAGRLRVSLFARHESLVEHRDFGVNQIGAQVRVTLWGRP